MTINYDFDEAAEGGDFVTLSEGRYVFKVIKVEGGESKAGNPKAVVTLQVEAGKEEYIGGVITQHWPTSGGASFRFRDFLKAVGVEPKTKGKADLRKSYGKTIGAIVTLREGDEDGSFFNDLKGLMPGRMMLDLLGIEESDEDEEEDGEGEDEEDGDESEDVRDWTEDELKEMDLGGLKELAEEWEVSTKKPAGKKLTQAVLRTRLLEAFEEAQEDEGEDGDEDEDEDEDEGAITEDDLKKMDLDELTELAEDWDVSTRKPRGKTLTAATMRKRLATSIEESEDEDEDGGEDEDDGEPF